MTNPTHTSLDPTPEVVAALRARLLAESRPEEHKPPAAPLCPTVRRLLEARRKGTLLSA